ncbi:MAG TPA: MFS transporter, partial [Solirubrobacteraceae bacterium]
MTVRRRAVLGVLRDVDPFSALRRNPAYRAYRVGATTSHLGTYVQRVAQGWLVYQLTGSAALLAAVALAGAAPGAVLSLVGGVLGDRHERRAVMVWTQSGMGLLALLLGALALTGSVQVWHVFAIALAAGVLQALDDPVRIGITADLVRPEDLPNAVATSMTLFNLCRMLGPVVGGVLLATVGP